MHDDDIEGLLKKYRPAAPERAFDERLLQSLERDGLHLPGPRTWPWAVAAAALLAIAVGLQAGPRGTADIDPSTKAAAETLAETSGGDETSREIAEWTLVTADRLSQRQAPPLQGVR